MTLSVVVGLGRSGTGAARLLKTQGSKVVVLEQADSEECKQRSAELRAKGIEVRLGQPLEITSFEPWLDEMHQVVISPGISWTHPTLEALRKRGVKVKGEMALAWETLSEHPWIGITGTNGKTTVTHLLHHVLSHGGLVAPMAGNVGYSAAELALGCLEGSTPQPDWVVMEMSSYQIEAAAAVAPRIGIWTTLTPDHLERHGSLDAYRAIKRGLLERSELAILNGDDPDISRTRCSWGQSRVNWVSTVPDGANSNQVRLHVSEAGWVCEGERQLFSTDALAMPGRTTFRTCCLSQQPHWKPGCDRKRLNRHCAASGGPAPARISWQRSGHSCLQRQQGNQLRRCSRGFAIRARARGAARRRSDQTR